jgi:lipopolysaccharide transport system ATP-binding protein
VRTVIKAENISKKYIIGHQQQEQYPTLRDAISRKFMAIGNRLMHPLLASSGQPLMDLSSTEEFWALKDITFEIQQGERVGIIGRNGAGKTTLLKILSCITEPTKGRVSIRGRVASLLEVGTGFHPELTGRENIYLNGAVLGMSKAETKKKFDEIVAFAEVEKFLDTPVKRYSSGMYVRLAFAVAAHLEPEVFLVDEVLAVGDASFQKKCLGKLGDVSREGRTVLFVSHNMGAINTLCDRAIWIDKGAIAHDGPVAQVVAAYMNQGSPIAKQIIWKKNERPGNQSFQLVSVTLKRADGVATSEINISEDATIEIECEVIRSGARAMFSLVFWDANGNCAFSSPSNTAENSYHDKSLNLGRYRSICSLYGHLLNEGRYYISIIGVSDNWSDGFRADHVLSFYALDDGVLKRDYPGNFSGVVRPRLIWKTIPIQINSQNNSYRE